MVSGNYRTRGRASLRNNERLFVGRDEIGLDGVPHAARFVDGRKVGHSGSQSEEEIAESTENWWSRVAERDQRTRGPGGPGDQGIRGSGESKDQRMAG